MTIRFVEEAQREFLDAISYYEEARAGLGRRFENEVDRSVLWIAEHPELYQFRSGGYRRINLRRFPYHLPYITCRISPEGRLFGYSRWLMAVASRCIGSTGVVK